jgi:hypothetical protein
MWEILVQNRTTSIFFFWHKAKKNTFSETIYNCSTPKLFGEDYVLNLSTGWGENTFYSKEFYQKELNGWDKKCVEEIKDLVKSPQKYTRALLNADIEINSMQVENFLEMQDVNIDAAEEIKNLLMKNSNPRLSIVFNPDILNEILSETGGNFTVDDEFIEQLKENAEDDNVIKEFEKLKGSIFSSETEGEHHHDGQVCDYTVTIFTPDNQKYHAHNSHCLVTGWNFYKDVKFE